MKNHINSIYVFKTQKRAEHQRDNSIDFNANPKGRRSRINIIQKVGGAIYKVDYCV